MIVQTPDSRVGRLFRCQTVSIASLESSKAAVVVAMKDFMALAIRLEQHGHCDERRGQDHWHLFGGGPSVTGHGHGYVIVTKSRLGHVLVVLRHAESTRTHLPTFLYQLHYIFLSTMSADEEDVKPKLNITVVFEGQSQS